MNFWKSLPRPFLALAPMADVTDAAFRCIIAKYGKPDVLWTEFVSADGLYHTREIQKLPDSENPLTRDLVYGENEHPIVAQLFTSKPEMMEYAAALMVELGFDGVDINMGCPDRSIEKQGAGAALMKTPKLAVELIKAAERGTRDKVPVSVKTRIGYNTNELETWLPTLLSAKPAAITIHARTRKELSLVPARWEHVAEAVKLRDEAGSDTLIIGNGDVATPAEAREKAETTGADGVMIGRGIFGNPWLFATLAHTEGGCQSERPSSHSPEHTQTESVVPSDNEGPQAAQSRNRAERSECAATSKTSECDVGLPSIPERLDVLIEHCDAYQELCGHKSFAVMKKHFKAYVTGFDGAKELRMTLMDCNNATEVREALTAFSQCDI